jgi:hypothetical protein
MFRESVERMEDSLLGYSLGKTKFLALFQRNDRLIETTFGVSP